MTLLNILNSYVASDVGNRNHPKPLVFLRGLFCLCNGGDRDLKFGTQVVFAKPESTDDKRSLIEAWPRPHDQFWEAPQSNPKFKSISHDVCL